MHDLSHDLEFPPEVPGHEWHDNDETENDEERAYRVLGNRPVPAIHPIGHHGKFVHSIGQLQVLLSNPENGLVDPVEHKNKGLPSLTLQTVSVDPNYRSVKTQ